MHQDHSGAQFRRLVASDACQSEFASAISQEFHNGAHSARVLHKLVRLTSRMQPEEQVISDTLLKVFRSCVNTLGKGTSKFPRDLQAALLPMLNKPSPSASVNVRGLLTSLRCRMLMARPQTMQEVAACLCAVIRGQTHDFAKLIAVFKACACASHLSYASQVVLTS